MTAEEYYQGNFRSQHNTMIKANKKLQQFDFYDLIEAMEQYAEYKVEQLKDK